MIRFGALRRLVPAIALASFGGAAVAIAPAAAPLVTVHPTHLPLSLGLPSGWQVTALTDGARFDAAATDGSARLAVTTGLYPGAFAAFAASETASARRFYRSQDPGASLTTHTVALRSGPALEIDVRLQHGSPLAISLFSILHDSVSYPFTSSTSQSTRWQSGPSTAPGPTGMPVSRNVRAK